MHPKNWRGPTWLVVLWIVVGLPFIYMLWQGPGPNAEPYMRSAMSWMALYLTGGWLIGAVALVVICVVTLPIVDRKERAASQRHEALFRRDAGPIIAGFLLVALIGVVVVARVIDTIR
jgi:hypothetical protein